MVKLLEQLKAAKKVSGSFSNSSGSQRNKILHDLEHALIAASSMVLIANKKDLVLFKGDSAMRERLELDAKKISNISSAIRQVRKLDDPLHKTLETRKLHNKLLVRKVSVPLGVVGVIYESRPNVTIDLAVLSIKTGNALVLKGGKESFFTNTALVSIIKKVLSQNGYSKDLLVLIDSKSDWKAELLHAHGLVDVLIPRGGAGLIEFIRQHARIPVIETGAGVCHIFLDEKYDLSKAVEIIWGSKVQRPSVCNALDTLVIHKKILVSFLQSAAKKFEQSGVELFADEQSYKILSSIYPLHLLHAAKSADYGKEFLSLKMSIKTVSSYKQGLQFIQAHGSGHSEAILTDSKKNARRFLEEIDAAVLYHNASTRFTDGGEFGMGAEVGISTQKLHARGPMGLESLTTYKWVVYGNGQMRAGR